MDRRDSGRGKRRGRGVRRSVANGKDEREGVRGDSVYAVGGLILEYLPEPSQNF